MEEIKRTERGWCGYIKGHQWCLFRRNTLLEYDDKKIVIATFGNYIDPLGFCSAPIVENIWYQTIAGYAYKDSDGYWEIDGEKQIPIVADHMLQGTHDEMFDMAWLNDKKANEMHERVVEEMMDVICKE